MSEDREGHWAELEARAHRLLEHAKEVEPREQVRRHGSLLRLWRFPAFGPQATWTILIPGRKGSPGATPLVREVTWEREEDHRRVFETADSGHSAPYIRLREAVLASSELDRILAAGTALTVPVVLAGNPAGLEGEYFGLETYAVSGNVRLQWWCAGPTEWRHFTDWVGELRSFLLGALDHTR
jgi:hypothetical protein